MPGHLTSFKVGGHFGAKGSSLNDRGAGRRLRRFNYASESIRSGTWSHHRHTESCKPNKTKQNKASPCSIAVAFRSAASIAHGTARGGAVTPSPNRPCSHRPIFARCVFALRTPPPLQSISLCLLVSACCLPRQAAVAEFRIGPLAGWPSFGIHGADVQVH